MPTREWVSSPWTQEEADEGKRLGLVATSSTYLELVNMLESVLILAKQKQKILCVSDNKAAVQIATDRYTKIESDKLIHRIQEFDLACLRRCLSVHFKWVPREDPWIKLADGLSRGQVKVLEEKLPFLKLPPKGGNKILKEAWHPPPRTGIAEPGSSGSPGLDWLNRTFQS